MFVKVKEGASEEETKALENSLDEFPSRSSSPTLPTT
jgi:hypothetical protein